MKKLILSLGLVILISLVSCSPPIKKKYSFQVTYTNGEVDTLVYRGVGNNYFRLKDADLVGGYRGDKYTLISGVRNFTVLSIREYGELQENETGWTNINGHIGCYQVIFDSNTNTQNNK